MIDYLFKSATEADMIAAVGSHLNLYRASAGGAPAGWRGDIAFPCSVTDNTDPANPVLLTDFHLWVGLLSNDAVLAANPACILVADRDAQIAGNTSFILHATMTPQEMSVYSISPVVAGSNYPFGAV